ncbi:MAG: aminopeptidase [Bacteroidota bacterium]
MNIRIKHIFYLLGLIVFGYLGFHYKLVGYGLAQAKGQFKIINEARPIADILADPDFPDSLKQTLEWVEEIKKFSVDSLGLIPNNNYEKVFDQKGEEILWVVTACDPYKFEPLMWDFPIIGSFTYKGFFDYEKAIKLARQKQEDGYDVSLRPVSAWSTLGWFSDPILSNMLADGTGELANTIIHELTHGTIFVPDSMTFNENLATFIGNRGAQEFLKQQYGENSQEFIDYSNLLADRMQFSKYIIQSTIMLDSMYNSFEDEPDSLKNIYKDEMIDRIISNLDTISFKVPNRYQGYFENYKPNNAYFVSFLNYRERQDELDIMLNQSMNNDLHAFVGFWKSEYMK